MKCSFCGAGGARRQLLAAADRDWRRSYICPQCVERCTRLMAEAPAADASQCTFCHGRWGGTRLVSSDGDPPSAAICDRCLEICQYIEKDDSAD